jgi:chaperonin GroEL
VGWKGALKEVNAALLKNSKKISSKGEIAQVATISAESREMGEMIASVIDEVGSDGVVTTEQSNTLGLSKEIVKGMNFDKGYISPYMMTDAESQTAEVSDPYILITDKKISAIGDIVPILNELAKTGKKDVVIIAEDVDGEALATLVVNRLRGVLNVLAVKAPEFGENRKNMFRDIAILTGGEVISEETGMKLEATTIAQLGRASKVIATKDDTTIVGGKGKKKDLDARVSEIKAQIGKTDSEYDKEKLKKRMAKLQGGVAVIRVGAATETELTYMKHKMEDAVNATKAAIEEGIVAGGGTALAKAAAFVASAAHAKKEYESHEYKAGYETLLRALSDPLRQIAANAGEQDPAVVLAKVIEAKGVNFGYNAADDTYEEDMVKAGIIDPV